MMRNPALLYVIFWGFAVMSSMRSGTVSAAETIDDTPGRMSWGVGDHYTLPTDADGWSIVEPGKMHRKIYAAADGVRDASGLSLESPVDLKTGLRMIRQHSSDWLLLRRGDTFDGGISLGPNMLGESPLCPILVGARHFLQEPLERLDETAEHYSALQRHVSVVLIQGVRHREMKNPKRIPFADNYVDVLVLTDVQPNDLDEEARREIMRVLTPLRGRAIIGDGVLRKPSLSGADDWTHRLHGPDNNPVSSDTAFQMPAMLQYLAMPMQTSFQGTTLVAGGRRIELSDWVTKILSLFPPSEKNRS